MLLNSMDDPLVDSSLIPFDLPQQNEHIILVTTEKGGHLGWGEGRGLHPTSHWHERLAIQFIGATFALHHQQAQALANATIT